MSRSQLWRGVQVIFVLAVLWYAGTVLARQWQDLRALEATLTYGWGYIALSCATVLLSYAVLIATWRGMVRAWGSRLAIGTAARIWFVSNLGRYVPGKVWQIGAMGTMAHAAGVAPEAAVGSSLVIAMVNLLAGFAVVAATGAQTVALAGFSADALWLPMAVLVIVVASLPWTLAPLVRLTARLTGRQVLAPTLPAAAIWMAALGCAAAWLLYGLAFRWLALGVLGPAVAGDAGTYVAVFTVSYLAGFLALFAPGGLGVREVVLGALLVGTGLTDATAATLLVLLSRLWLTVLEVLPGVLLLAWPVGRGRQDSSIPLS